MVEGYMDVIALHRAGFATAVAPLGTALTEAQIEELWRMAPEPVLCFDGDSAGQRAAARALTRALPILKPGLSLRFAILPAAEDPDSLILHHGAEAMRALLDRARRWPRCCGGPRAQSRATRLSAVRHSRSASTSKFGSSPTAACKSITVISFASAWPRCSAHGAARLAAAPCRRVTARLAGPMIVAGRSACDRAALPRRRHGAR